MRVRLLLAFLLVLGPLGSVAQAHDMSTGVVGNARLGAPANAPPARSLASATGHDRRYALANGCYSLRSAAGFVGKDAAGYSAAVGRPAAPRASACRPPGSARISSTAATATSWPPARSARSRPRTARARTPTGAWTRPRRRLHDRPALAEQGARRDGRPPGADRSAGRGRVHVRARPGLRGVPGGRDLRHRQAVHQPHAVGRGEGHDRPPPARHGVRVPRRQGALRQAVVSLRRALRARRLSRSPGRERLRRRPRERPLRQPGALPRPGGLADLQGLAEPRLADPRADLLQVDRARVHGRAARDGEPVRREQAAVRAVSLQAERLRRDGLGAPPEQGHRGAPGLHRRPERRPRPRLVPHRDQPVPGAAGDRAGQARGDQGHRGVGAVRLPRLQRRAAVRPGPDRPRDRRRPRHGRAPDGADQQVRQRARRRGRRQRLDRRGRERRQPARHRQVLADAALHGPARRARQAAARRVRPRRERHPQPRDRAVPAARRGAGLPERLELQRARPDRSRRPRRPQADAEPDHHRPGPPQREGAQERDGPDRGGALLRRRVEPQLEHRRRDPADLQARRRGHADEGIGARLDQDLEGDEGAARQALLLRVRLRRGPERPGVAARAARGPSSYPFKSFDGKVTFERQRSGERLFDFTKDGVAHYGLFPDWWEDVRTTAGGPRSSATWRAGRRRTCRSGSACTASATAASRG